MSTWTNAYKLPKRTEKIPTPVKKGPHTYNPYGNTGIKKRKKAYPPVLSSNPASNIEIGVGASTWASGNHK
jgi:hypothetical protein